MKSAKWLVLCVLVPAAYAMEGTPERVLKASVNSDGIQVVEIVGGEYFFDPNRIVVKANVPVEIKARKEPGMVPHNIVIDAAEAGVRVEEPIGKEPGTIRVTFNKPGTYPFYCSKKLLFFRSHRERGMQGILEVIE